MNLTCPCCHATVSLETMTQDEAARELLALRAEIAPGLWPHLVAYLGLFRSPKRALAWSRAVRLAKEALELCADQRALAAAMAETVEALRAKRDAGQVKPLANHNYLKRVLESTAAALPALSGGAELPAGFAEVKPGQAGRARAGKLVMAEQVLAEWAGGDWLAEEIAAGFTALLAKRVGKAPSAEEIDRTASLWLSELSRVAAVEAVDRDRVFRGFKALLKTAKWWPGPEDLIAEMPRRPTREKLPEPGPSDEARAAAKAAAAKIRESL